MPICVIYAWHSMIENEISYIIRGAEFNVYSSVGPDLLEHAYEVVLRIELKQLS